MEKVSNLVVARFESSSLKNYLKTKLAETNELRKINFNNECSRSI